MKNIAYIMIYFKAIIMNKRLFNKKVYGEMAEITRALGNPHRLEILDLLSQGPSSVAYISENTSLTVANASQHLQVLKQAKLLETERKGKNIFYRLSSRHVFDTWCALRKLGMSQNAEISRLIDDYRSNRNNLNIISKEELSDKMKGGDIIIIDVRPEEEYKIAHIEGALSIPLPDFHERVNELPADKAIVAYCRGPLCVMADDAVDLLTRHGYKATRLEQGFPEWKANGLPVEPFEITV